MIETASLPRPDSESGWAAILADDAALTGGVAAICRRHGLDATRAVRYASGSLPVYALDEDHVLKLYPPHEQSYASIEARALVAVCGALPVPTPRLLAADGLDGWHYLLMSRLHGRSLVDAWPELSLAERDRFASELGHCTAALHALDVAPVADFEPHWDAFIAAQRASAAERQRVRRLEPRWIEQIPAFLDRWMPPVTPRRALLHTELMREHLLVAQTQAGPRLSGLFDFEPSMVGEAGYDFASFGLFVSCGDARFLRRALLAYGYAPGALDGALQCRFMAWAILHRYSNLRWYLERLPADGATTLEQLAARWWALD